jgi:hypothetical protein
VQTKQWFRQKSGEEIGNMWKAVGQETAMCLPLLVFHNFLFVYLILGDSTGITTTGHIFTTTFYLPVF